MANRSGGEIDVYFLIGAQGREGLTLLCPREEIAAGGEHLELILGRVLFPYQQQTVGMRIGRPEQDSIYHAKNRRSSAETESECSQGNEGETWRRPQQTDAVSGVPSD